MFSDCPKARKSTKSVCETTCNVLLDGVDRFFSCRKEKNKSFTGKTLAQKSMSSCFAPVQDVRSLFKVIDASVSSKSKTDNALELYDSASNHIWLSTIFVSTEIVKVLLSAEKNK